MSNGYDFCWAAPCVAYLGCSPSSPEALNIFSCRKYFYFLSCNFHGGEPLLENSLAEVWCVACFWKYTAEYTVISCSILFLVFLVRFFI